MKETYLTIELHKDDLKGINRKLMKEFEKVEKKPGFLIIGKRHFNHL